MPNKKFRSGIFVSYSHADREWLSRLQTHLAPYLAGETLNVWDDTNISVGAKWDKEIERAMAKARVAVFLVSPDFLASDYIRRVELPTLLNRANKDLTVVWVPIRASAYDATPIKDFQAAHDPKRPLATLPKAKQDAALVEIAKRIASVADINAVGNAFKIIDDFEPEVSAFVQGQPEPVRPPVHSIRLEQVNETIHMVDHGDRRVLITAKDLESLDPNAQKLIRAYERTMRVLFERWTELKPKRIAEDAETRREARVESDDIRRELCDELSGLLGFIESMGMSLQDHYWHVRHICSQQ